MYLNATLLHMQTPIMHTYYITDYMSRSRHHHCQEEVHGVLQELR